MILKIFSYIILKKIITEAEMFRAGIFPNARKEAVRSSN